MPQKLDPDEVSAVSKHLFKLFAQAKNIPPDDYPSLSPAPFLAWLREDATLTEFNLAAELGVSVEACAHMLNLAVDPSGANRLIAMWPYITLAMRPMRNELRSMQLFLVLAWTDGTVCPLSIFLHKDIVDGELNDASVCSTVTSNSGNLVAEVLDKGLDAIHDDRQTNGLFGAERIIQLTQDLANGKTTRDKVPDSDMAAVNQLLLFVASMFPADIPQELKDQVAAQRAAQRGWDQRKAEEGLEGGFDGG
jgi:hypothetical protein